MTTIHRTIVAAVLHTTDDCILLGKVREGGVYPNCWHIPGGGIEPNESLTDALAREIKEETGIDISHCSTQLLDDMDTGESIKTDKHTGEQIKVFMQFHQYLVELPTKADQIQVRLDDDLIEYRWVPTSKLSEYKHTPPSQKLFKKMGWI